MKFDTLSASEQLEPACQQTTKLRLPITTQAERTTGLDVTQCIGFVTRLLPDREHANVKSRAPATRQAYPTTWIRLQTGSMFGPEAAP